jgi:hypothetical protein
MKGNPMGRPPNKKSHIEQDYQDRLKLDSGFFVRLHCWTLVLEKYTADPPDGWIPTLANVLASHGYTLDNNDFPKGINNPTYWKERFPDTLVYLYMLPGDLEYKANLLEGAILLVYSAISYKELGERFGNSVTPKDCWSVFLQSNLVDYVKANGYSEKHIKSDDFAIDKGDLGQRLRRLEEKMANNKLQK